MLPLDIPQHSCEFADGRQALNGSRIQIWSGGAFAPVTIGSLIWEMVACNSICNKPGLTLGLRILVIVELRLFKRVVVVEFAFLHLIVLVFHIQKGQTEAFLRS
jgi:hypothetical protein